MEEVCLAGGVMRVSENFTRNLVLNPQQAEAIKHFTGPMLVLAGPGSGKTTVIAHRTACLIEQYQVNPADILVITFTRAAAREMKERFIRLSPERRLGNPNFGTFHSVFFKILRRAYGYSTENVLSDHERSDMILKAAALAHAPVEDGQDFLQTLSGEISYVKNELVSLEHYYSPNMGAETFREVYARYEEEKSAAGKLDFDDMLIKCYDLLIGDENTLAYWRKRFPFILVDEFQDINAVQYQCVQLLAQPQNNLFAVGDDDQSIYRFRGATPELLLQFPKDFAGAKTVTLAVNYRSSDKIIKAAAKVIGENTRRYPKNITGTSRGEGKLSLITSEDIASEAFAIAKRLSRLSVEEWDDTAVLYRTNIQGRAFVDALRDMKIPFRVKDSVPSIFEHWILKDIAAYLKLSLDNTLDTELARVINRPSRFISKVMLNSARALAARTGSSLFENLLHGPIVPSWQKEHLIGLQFYLNAIKSRSTYEAVKYIRQAVDYEQYIKDYAEYRKMNPAGLLEILNELQEAAKAHPDFYDYILYAGDAARQAREEEPANRAWDEHGVTLSTMHSAKGMEYETVYVAGCVEGVLPHDKCRTEPEIEEERRLFYVAMTRAKTNLILSVTKTRYDMETEPTRFLEILRKGSGKG